MIDVNVSLSRWPFRRLPDDEPEALVKRLRRLGVTEAWAGSFDALLHQDVAAVNARLAEACRSAGEGFLRPFGAVNPRLPDWREDVRRCADVHKMPGVRLHPNYHGYGLDDPLVAELFDECARRRLVVQVALRMEDDRTLHPLLKDLPPTDPAPLARLMARAPHPKVVLVNALRDLRGEPLKKLLAADDLYVDVAMQEGVRGVEEVVGLVGPDRVLFGSHAPFFVAESAHLKLKESELTPAQAEAIRTGNARRLLS
jgi:predicted TIM-barrel fold metal-dependent hydrolase